jgi:hypothetical protein
MRSRTFPPSRFHTGVSSTLPLMSHSAISRPLMAPQPTTLVRPWPIIAMCIFWVRRSIWAGSSPISNGARSLTAVSTTRGQPLHSPMPVTPWSVTTRTNSQLREDGASASCEPNDPSAAQAVSGGAPTCMR